MASEEQPTKRLRRANFSDEEMLTMIQGWLDRKAVLQEKFSRQVTAEKKRTAWDEITCAVNAVSRVAREREEVKKKFVDFKSVVKKKCAALKREQERTGGGVPEVKPLANIEEAMVATIKDVQVSGLPGLRDPHPTSDDEEDLSAGDTDVTPLPSRPASPRPGSSSIQTLLPISSPEPLSPYTQTEAVVEIESESAPPQGADDHHYSQPRQAGRNQTGSSRREATLAPEMLHIQEDIRNSLSDLTECITTYLPAIARSLHELASRSIL